MFYQFKDLLDFSFHFIILILIKFNKVIFVKYNCSRHDDKVRVAGHVDGLGGEMDRVRDSELIEEVEHLRVRSQLLVVRTGEEVPVGAFDVAILYQVGV